MNLKLEGVTHMKMTTDDYKLHVSGTVDKYSEGKKQRKAAPV